MTLLKTEANPNPEGQATQDGAGGSEPQPAEAVPPAKAGADDSTDTPTDSESAPKAAEQPEEAAADTPKDDDPKEGEDAVEEPEGAPESYEWTDTENTAPEVLEAFEGLARELDMPQDRAQDVLNRLNAAKTAADERVVKEWQEALEKDSEIGGEKLSKTMARAKTALDHLGIEGFTGLLEGPLGSHPDVIRVLNRVADYVGPDRMVGGDTPHKKRDINDNAALGQAWYGRKKA